MIAHFQAHYQTPNKPVFLKTSITTYLDGKKQNSHIIFDIIQLIPLVKKFYTNDPKTITGCPTSVKFAFVIHYLIHYLILARQ